MATNQRVATARVQCLSTIPKGSFAIERNQSNHNKHFNMECDIIKYNLPELQMSEYSWLCVCVCDRLMRSRNVFEPHRNRICVPVLIRLFRRLMNEHCTIYTRAPNRHMRTSLLIGQGVCKKWWRFIEHIAQSAHFNMNMMITPQTTACTAYLAYVYVCTQRCL